MEKIEGISCRIIRGLTATLHVYILDMAHDAARHHTQTMPKGGGYWINEFSNSNTIATETFHAPAGTMPVSGHKGFENDTRDGYESSTHTWYMEIGALRVPQQHDSSKSLRHPSMISKYSIRFFLLQPQGRSPVTQWSTSQVHHPRAPHRLLKPYSARELRSRILQRPWP